MDGQLLQDAMSIYENTKETPEYIDEEAIYTVVSELAALVYEAFAKDNEESGGTLGVDAFAAYLPSAIGAAYIAGRIEQATTTNLEGLTIPGKSGTIVNIHIS
jgi:hypothetical protein